MNEIKELRDSVETLRLVLLLIAMAGVVVYTILCLAISECVRIPDGCKVMTYSSQEGEAEIVKIAGYKYDDGDDVFLFAWKPKKEMEK